MKQSLKHRATSKFFRSAALTLLCAAPFGAQACNDQPYIGTVCTFAFSYCPTGYMAADGTLLPIQQYAALYSLLGTTYGGNGTTNFGLPDLRGRLAVGAGAGPGLTPVVLGQKDGTQSVTLTANNLPAHVHPATVGGTVTVQALNGDNPPSGGVNIPTATNNTVGKTGTSTNFYPPSANNKVAVPTTNNLTATVSPNVTTNTPVSTTQPRLGLTVCIATEGIYPVRP